MLVVKLITRNFMFLSNGLYLSDAFLHYGNVKKALYYGNRRLTETSYM